MFDRTSKEDKTCLRYLEGRDIGRYSRNWSGMWMSYGAWLAQPRELGMFSRPRILLREITSPPPHCINATFVKETFLNNKSILNVLEEQDDIERLKVLCAILNSRLMTECYRGFAVKSARRIFPKIVIRNLREFPIPKSLMLGDPRAKAKYSKMVTLVDRMLDLHKNLDVEKNPETRKHFQIQLRTIDRQIDRVVYQLYQLTPAEIDVIEDAATTNSSTDSLSHVG